MKKTVILLSVLVLAISCCGKESFNILDTKEFNDKIANRTDIKTPDELIKLYYNYDDLEMFYHQEGKQSVTIRVVSLRENRYEITLIHEGLLDDSQSGEKIVMTAKQTGASWTVTEIKKNWKCWAGRGHTNWGTELCH